MTIARRAIRYFLVLAIALVSFSAHAEKRIALVIGNADYQNTPKLGNPLNDAEDVASALRRVGFTVQIERNLGKRDMEYALARFARAADGADAAMFFYAGHGIQYRGTNYLMPIDARLEDDVSVNYELVRIDDVMFGLERARGVKLLVLDACRNNPLLDRLIRRGTTRDVSVSRGLARVDPTGGMIVAYSTRADQVAIDGDGRNSPFTGAFVKYIDEPGLEIGSLFRRVAIEVDRLTGGRQLPETWVTLRGEFYLNTQDTDLQAWAKVRLSDDPAQLSEFMQRYPRSALMPEARQRIALIEQARLERERAERERIDQAAREQVERAAREAAARAQAEREQAALQQVAREQMERAAREAAARAQAEREQAALQQAAREQAERAAREAVARAQAEREQAAREQAERIVREAAAGAQAEREQAAREQALRDQLAHERAERERIEREQAELLERQRQQAQSPNAQIAMIPPPSAPPAVAAIVAPSGSVLVREIKAELRRVGCLTGPVDDRWSIVETRASIAKFARYAKLHDAPREPTPDFLDVVRRSGARVCPLECGAGKIERSGSCVAKACPQGQSLARNGECEDREPKKRTAARPDPMKYSMNIWGPGVVRDGATVSQQTPLGRLTCIGGNIQTGKHRACRWE